MLYVVLFEDNPDVGSGVRQEHMPAHLEFLQRNAGSVKAAGPLKSESGEPAGGIWIVDADDTGAVDVLVKEDPFWPTGLRRSIRILSWFQVFANGQRLIDG